MTDSKFHSYLKNQSSFREKWKDYLKRSPDFDHTDRLDILTPFYGTSEYSTLSEENKNDLFLNNIRLMAEALIVFEQILLLGYFTNRKKPRYSPDSFSAPFSQFSFEELYHSMGFKHFLSSHEIFKKFPNEMITNCRWLKNAFVFIVRKFPGALYICSPRIEALSISYFHEVQDAYGPDADNSWLLLNRLHHQDEIYHIPLNYHFHDAFIEEHGFVKTFFGSMFFFIMIQVMLMKLSFEVISQSFPKMDRPAKALWTFRYMKWLIKIARAHKDARPIMKRNFNKMKPRYRYAFYFLTK
jgi:hypothetical protein